MAILTSTTRPAAEGFAEKLRVWVPHELSENNKENRLQIVSTSRPLSSNGIVTGDEKWCQYINMKQRKEWVAPGDTPKPRVKIDLHPKKTMIFVWWDWEGMVHWEILERMPRSTRSSTKPSYIA